MKVFVTGSAGLIGGEAVTFFDALGFEVTGVDSNARADFFGPAGDTTPNRQRLEMTCRRYRHLDLDIRDREAVLQTVAREQPQLIVHAAAQPSHELAALRPFDDFDVNAVGTLNLLEACRRHAPDVVFVTLSTNKVYGDGPNQLDLVELETRWAFSDAAYAEGIDESLPTDQTMHSLFGASKVAADVLTQEYGLYFGMKTGTFRAGCLTGPNHRGVELHGFLSHLVNQAVRGNPYTVFGHKGKQVRDQIHSYDAVAAVWAFAQNPRPGAVYNLGGGRLNAASVVECIEMVERSYGGALTVNYSSQARRGDHICYYTNLGKFRTHFPDWQITHGLEQIIDEMVGAAVARLR